MTLALETNSAPWQHRASSLREAFFRQAWLHLRSPEAEREADAAWRWLGEYGLARNEAELLPIGLLSDTQRIRENLLDAGFSREEITASELAADPRLTGRLVGPIRELRDQGRRILSFWARRLDETPPRFLFRGGWKDRLPAFGLETALPVVRGGAPLILVEDLLESMLLHAKGVANAAAIGGRWNEMTAARWDQLAKLGVERTAVLPSAGWSNGKPDPVLPKRKRSGVTPAVAVVRASQLEGRASAREMIRACGVESFQAMIRSLFARPEDCFPQEPAPTASAPAAVRDEVAQTTRLVGQAKQPRYCRFHRCDPLACFCFD